MLKTLYVAHVTSLPETQEESKNIYFYYGKIIERHSDLNKYLNLITGLEILMC